MDTSEQYIKMCEKAEEIQSLRPKLQDYKAKDYKAHLKETPINSPLYGKRRTVIWLPRQDQLQEMIIPDPFRDWRNVLSFFDDFIDWDNLDEYGSMEQLWLAFVVKEKYNKVWDGREWI